jgi:hypothetical protein
MIDELKMFNIPNIEEIDDKHNELKEQFIEMSQLKSDFDIDKFTIKKHGKFIAHNFHFLMRQYSLALYESKRIFYDIEEKKLQIEELQQNRDEKDKFAKKDGKYINIELKRLHNEINQSELSLVNKLAMIDRFEKARKILIEQNGGEITNAQYQSEEPHFWKDILEKKALWQAQQRVSGISEGVWENIHALEEDALLDKNNKVKVLDDNTGKLNLQKIEQRIQKDLNFKERIKQINKKGE